jgi:hypothetical protein
MGTINHMGNVIFRSGSKLNQTGGLFKIDPNDGTAAGSTSATTNTFEYNYSGNNPTLNGGIILINDPPYTGTPLSFNWIGNAYPPLTCQSLTLKLGGNIGTNSSAANSGGFIVNNCNSNTSIKIATIEVNGGASSAGGNRFAQTPLTAGQNLLTDVYLKINLNSELRDNTTTSLICSGAIVNNGILTTINKMQFCTYSGGTFSNSNRVQTITGTGIFRNALTNPTASFNNVDVNTNLIEFSGWNSNISLNNLNLIDGKLIMGSNMLIVGESIVKNGSITYGSNPTYQTTIIGKVKKWYGTTPSPLQLLLADTDYNNRNVQINWNGSFSTGGSIVTEYIKAAPDANGLPYTINNQLFNHVSPTGYWKISTADNLNYGTATYNATFATQFFKKQNNVDFITLLDSARVISRAFTATTWQDPSVKAGTTGIVAGLTLEEATIAGQNTPAAIFAISGKGESIGLIPVIASPDVTLDCNNPSTTLTVSGGAVGNTYLWSTNQTSISINVSPTITTTYRVTASNGATDSVTVFVNKTAPIVNAGADITLQCGQSTVTITATGGTSYIWSTSDMVASITVSPTVSTTYVVTATGSNGCAASDNIVVTPMICSTLSARIALSSIIGANISNTPNFPTTDPYANGSFNGKFTHINNPIVASINPNILNTVGNNAILDWVFLELRTGVSGATTVAYTKAVLLQSDGDLVDTDGVSPVRFQGAAPSNYFITIRHRNHLGFRTANAIALSASVTGLDFTNNSLAIYGAIANGSQSFIMIGGDADADGSIDSNDSAIWQTQNGLYDNYFLNSDFNMDGSVDSTDSAIWELNNGKYEELN